jgi:hypothetical protein
MIVMMLVVVVMRMIVLVMVVVSMIVSMIVLVVMMVPMGARDLNPLIEQHGSDPHNGKPRDRAQHGVNLLRHHEPREEQRRQTEQENGNGMGERDHAAEKDRMLRRSVRSHQVRRYYGLAVAGRHGVDGAQSKRHRQPD